MEHRYGKRIPAKMMSVVIDYRKCNFCSPGKISDVSYSGVLVRTNTPLPLFALVQLRLVTRADNVLRLHNLDAHVVRYTQDSVAFAWNQPHDAEIITILEGVKRHAPPPTALPVMHNTSPAPSDATLLRFPTPETAKHAGTINMTKELHTLCEDK